MVADAAELGAYALQQLRDLARQFPIISDVRGLGLVMGIELEYRNDQGFRPATLEAEKVLTPVCSGASTSR